MTRRPLPHRVLATGAALLVFSLAAWGCDRKETEPQQSTQAPVRYKAPVALDRELTQSEMDSLRAMKLTHDITRDEYWEDYGGVLANDRIEVWYPDGKASVFQGAAMLKYTDLARARVAQTFGREPEPRVVIVCNGDLDIYRATTGRDWWQYSRIYGDTIAVQSPIDMHTRGILAMVASREYFEWAVGKLAGGKAPRWVEEGLASQLAGEGAVLESQRTDFPPGAPVPMTLGAIEDVLQRERERRETRRAFYNAFRMVDELVKRRGMETVARWVVAMGESASLDDASRAVMGADYDAVVAEASEWAALEPGR